MSHNALRLYVRSDNDARYHEMTAFTKENARGTETVLVAEDQDAVRTVVKRILQARGYTVLEATNGDEAVALAKAHTGRIDLLISDLVMPKMGGLALAERLAHDRPDMKVLLMSGYAENHASRDQNLSERICFIEKPFTVEKLATTVRTMLDQGGACD